MDAFDIKLQKRNAMSKQHQLCKVANLLRFVEVCILLVLISRFTTHLPVAFGEYFRGLSVLLVSPRFVFVVGNAIVITLFAKAGQFSPSRTDITRSSSRRGRKATRLGSEKYVKQSDPEEEPVKSSCPEDGMSNEQFRNTVEAFIARQKKLLREEEYSVILRDLE
ncbi:hypothetical protein F3Y22_tig00110108pilonHSYRG00088 [Hibiscus syriacus]|uniref:DUF4408 domain-containing protein n=1 Tax=Hibiscus syriacus TaxID=106335 RepID=A0A6A3BJN3_HIBSY|nr:hypothetical protein F3Y22_tig00110108pilonHSYRG00088 [Hibiscus syriacus]